MKYAIILPDGAPDVPLPQLDGRTPLQAAHIPHMDWVAAHGVLGRAVTVPAGFTPATDVGTMSLFGYSPNEYYTGRAPIEAAAQGLSAGPDEIIFRCNFVAIVDGRMNDYTAGHISQDEAARLIADLNTLFAGEHCRFHTGVSYRNLMITNKIDGQGLECAPPHDIYDKRIADHIPRGPNQEWVRGLMRRAAEMLVGHDVNRARADEGRAPVTDIWLWGHGRPTKLEPLIERCGLRGACITGVDIIRGLAVLMGLDLIEVEGATGYLDTNFAGKGAAAAAALDDYDLIVVHVEAPDEAGHLGDADEKVKALERMDKLTVGPLLEKLRTFDAWRVLVAPDHPTPVSTTAHDAAPPLFCFAGSDLAFASGQPFCEQSAIDSGLLIDPGHDLLKRFLGK